mmetsp:Transcript_5037/g.15827  ORF Transcript_5037/g.15827 Transcript_5037/m.15827 type:complete len:205 (-) Transcript_5037:147-761(-)
MMLFLCCCLLLEVRPRGGRLHNGRERSPGEKRCLVCRVRHHGEAGYRRTDRGESPEGSSHRWWWVGCHTGRGWGYTRGRQEIGRQRKNGGAEETNERNTRARRAAVDYCETQKKMEKKIREQWSVKREKNVAGSLECGALRHCCCDHSTTTRDGLSSSSTSSSKGALVVVVVPSPRSWCGSCCLRDVVVAAAGSSFRRTLPSSS